MAAPFLLGAAVLVDVELDGVAQVLEFLDGWLACLLAGLFLVLLLLLILSIIMMILLLLLLLLLIIIT